MLGDWSLFSDAGCRQAKLGCNFLFVLTAWSHIYLSAGGLLVYATLIHALAKCPAVDGSTYGTLLYAD